MLPERFGNGSQGVLKKFAKSGAGGIRTPYLRDANATFYRLNYGPGYRNYSITKFIIPRLKTYATKSHLYSPCSTIYFRSSFVNLGWRCCWRFSPDLSGCEPNLPKNHPSPKIITPFVIFFSLDGRGYRLALERSLNV
jgi:hypothetical protein